MRVFLVINIVFRLLGLINCKKLWLWVLVILILVKFNIILVKIVIRGLMKLNLLGIGSKNSGVSIKLVINSLIINFIVWVNNKFIGICLNLIFIWWYVVWNINFIINLIKEVKVDNIECKFLMLVIFSNMLGGSSFML